jgi:hypothetical protein
MSVQDALRLYLINSPVVKGEPLRFKKEGVYSVVSRLICVFQSFLNLHVCAY